MKIYCFLFMFIILFFPVYAADPNPFNTGTKIYVYTTSDTVRITGNSSIRTYHDAAKYLEERYNIKLETEEIKLVDKNNNFMILLVVNIVTDKSYNKIFSGSAHSSIMIEEIMLNLLQPYLSRLEWKIDALILKLNGVFTGDLGSDRTYSTLVTKEELLYYLWGINEEDGG